MKGKYITTQILLACLSQKKRAGNDIHAQLKETIAERKRLSKELEKLLLPKSFASKKDIHAQLAETIAERRRIIKEVESLLAAKRKRFIAMEGRKAA